MSTLGVKKLALAVGMLWAIGGPRSEGAQVGVGTWVRQGDAADKTGSMTMTVEACCGAGYHPLFGGIVPPSPVDDNCPSSLQDRQCPSAA